CSRMQQRRIFIHIVGVFAVLVEHGCLVGVLYRLRSERDPVRINALLQLSSSSIQLFYWSTGLLVAAGGAAAFTGHFWTQGGWLYAAIVVLLVTSVAMVRMAKPYYGRVRFISQAMSGGSK